MQANAKKEISDEIRLVFGLLFGLIVMTFVVRIFRINSFDFENIRNGTQALIRGINPWTPDTYVDNFYNPPYSVLFLWPTLFITPQTMILIGGTLLFAFVFYKQAWVAIAWFGTNLFLWLIAAGSIDMYVMGAGLILLTLGDKYRDQWFGFLLRVLAFGFLAIKFQGGLYVIIIYILMRRDWKALLVCVLVYGLPFARYYPDWIMNVLNNVPNSQANVAHSIWAQYSFGFALCVAVAVMLARKWKYWELGGALAGIMASYGMAGIPMLLTMMSIKNLFVIPVILVFNATIAIITWKETWSPYLAAYIMGMTELILILACLLPVKVEDDEDTVDLQSFVKPWFQGMFSRFRKTEKIEVEDK